MKKTIQTLSSILISSILAFNLIIFGIQPALANDYYFGAISEINKETFYLGDIISIETGICHSKSKPTTLSSKLKLQIYVNNTWKNVGINNFQKSSFCSKKTPYLQVFEWEVDQLGTIGSDGYSGTLRLRDATKKPAIYVNIKIFESAESEENAKAERIAEANLAFRCLILGGEWDSTRKICIGGSQGL